MIPDRLGPYRIERLLGAGGMGAVYAGVNDATGERAAIKVLAPQIAADENFRARFESEIETLKKLRHPHIVQLYGYGEYQRQLFYSMELVEGCSLQEKVKAEGPLDWRQAVAIGIDVAMALKHAHDRGIIHRDLKPANLLIDEHGQVKLTDFGIAKLFGGNSLTAVGGVMGTADYMAPEQADGSVVNHRVDLYSLGGVLYCLLTGRPPFLGNSLVELLDMLKHDKPTPVSRLMPKVPPAIDLIIMQLLEKNPNKRIPTALAAANQLRSLAHALSAENTLVDDAVNKQGGFHVSDSPTDVVPRSEESAKIASRETAFAPAPDQTSDSGAEVVPDRRPGDSAADASMGRYRAEYYDDAAGDAPTSQQSDDPPADNRFIPVTAEELGRDDRSQFEFDDEAASWLRLAAIAIGIVILAVLGWYTLRKPTADALWSDIEQVAAGDDAERFYAAEEQIDEFLARFPDHPRAEDARRYGEEIELMRLQRRLERRLRHSTDVQSLMVVEQLYLEAMAQAASEPHETVARLESLVALYQSDAKADEQTRQIVDLARRQIERLRSAAVKSQRQHLALLDERLKLAASLGRSDPPAALEIYRAIVVLYGAKPWAADLVRKAEQAAAALEKSPPPADSETLP